MTLPFYKRKFRFRKSVFSFFLFFSLFFSIQAQQCININAPNSVKNNDPVIIADLNDEVLNIRYFHYNPILKNLTRQNISDTLFLDFFENKQFKAVIKHVSEREDGTILVRATILHEDFATCIMVISEEGFSISVQLPLSNEAFFVTKKNERQYLSHCNLSQLRSREIEGSTPIPAPKSHRTNSNNGNIITRDLDTALTIDLLIVYTKAAAQWATGNSSVTDMNHVIDLAVELANEIMENSQTNITFHVVHKYQTDYEEVNSEDDLSRLQNPNDGYLDEVHEYRRKYKADIVILIADIDFTGGLAFLLNDLNGLPNAAFALVRVQQTANSYTFVHEIGHNMGCQHHKEQIPQPKSGLYPYSYGWRSTSPENRFSTVMTYEDGSYFLDGITCPRIPYFSSPLITHKGEAIGHSTDGDNARTLKQIKGVVADYSGMIDASLSEIVTDTGILSPNFHPDITYYTVVVPSSTSSITVTATAQYTYAQIYHGEGTHELNTGENEIIIKVKADDGITEKFYTLNVVRLSISGINDSTLMNLSISEGTLTPAFLPTITQYNANVSYHQNEIGIAALPVHSDAMVNGVKGLYTEVYPLNWGDNTISLHVTAADGIATATYQINVNRFEKNNDAYLQEITISHGTLTPDFSPEITQYKVSLTGGLHFITISSVTNDTNATVEGNGTYTVVNGENNIALSVTAQDGVTTKQYRIKFICTQGTDATLVSLALSEGTLTPVFSPEILEYYAEVSSETERLQVTAIPNDQNATVVGNGSHFLNSGNNIIHIMVLAENRIEQNFYKIIVNRASTINETTQQSLLIYPNPASDRIIIKSEKNMDIIRLYDGQGRLLQQIEKTGNEYEMNLDLLKTGIYFLFKDGKMVKIVKMRQ